VQAQTMRRISALLGKGAARGSLVEAALAEAARVLVLAAGSRYILEGPLCTRCLVRQTSLSSEAMA
jgi:hypothetical protein